MAQIIALIGARGSGVALAAKHLTRERGFTMINMGAPVERMLEAGLGIDPLVFRSDACREPLDGPGGYTPVDLRNSLFHDWGRRRVHGSIWARAWGRLVERSGAERIVLKDAAYPAEIREVRDRGGVVWRIDRPGAEPRTPADEIVARIEADRTILNKGDDPAVLYRLLDVGLASLGGEG